jgi:hypothetical protein
MRHFADPAFWAAYEKRPRPVRTRADKKFEILSAIRVIPPCT